MEAERQKEFIKVAANTEGEKHQLKKGKKKALLLLRPTGTILIRLINIEFLKMTVCNKGGETLTTQRISNGNK